MFTALFITAKIRCKSDVHPWLSAQKKNVVYISHEMSIGHQKNEVLICSAKWLELDNIILSEISKIEKIKYQGFLVIQ